MKTYKLIIITLLIILLCSPFLFIFYNNFQNQKISDSISDWGSFGDFIGGTLSTFISILTLIVTIVIAFQISKIEDNRNNKIIKEENRRFVRQLREQEYHNISQEIDKIWVILTLQDKNHMLNELYILDNNFYSFITHKKHLFQILNNEDFKKLSNIFTEIHKFASENEITEVNYIPHINNLSKIIEDFHIKIQTFIIEN